MDTSSFPSIIEGLDDSGAEEGDYERIWALLRRVDEKRGEDYDLDEAWAELESRLDVDEEAAENDDPSVDAGAMRRTASRRPQPSGAPIRRRRWTQGLVVAALVACVIGVGAWWWSRPASVSTEAGDRTTVSLPDGSIAELNGDTAIEYVRGFRGLPLIGAAERRIQLDGEAFFSVESRDRPFRVETTNGHVEAIGTEFIVRARTRDDVPETQVALLSGTVRVGAIAGPSSEAGDSVVLDERGQLSRVVGEGSAPSPPEARALKYVPAWRQGGFALSDASVPRILRELEHRFGTSLRLGVPEEKTDPMTLHYAPDVHLEDVLHDVCLVQDLRCRETSQGYELVRD